MTQGEFEHIYGVIARLPNKLRSPDNYNNTTKPERERGKQRKRTHKGTERADTQNAQTGTAVDLQDCQLRGCTKSANHRSPRSAWHNTNEWPQYPPYEPLRRSNPGEVGKHRANLDRSSSCKFGWVPSSSASSNAAYVDLFRRLSLLRKVEHLALLVEHDVAVRLLLGLASLLGHSATTCLVACPLCAPHVSGRDKCPASPKSPTGSSGPACRKTRPVCTSTGSKMMGPLSRAQRGARTASKHVTRARTSCPSTSRNRYRRKGRAPGAPSDGRYDFPRGQTLTVR